MSADNINQLAENVFNFFDQANELANLNGLTIRKGKITGSDFCITLVMGFLNTPLASLDNMCQLMSEQNIKITQQGLHQRFSESALKLRSSFFNCACEQFPTHNPNIHHSLNVFKKVMILDSTYISLPEGLKKEIQVGVEMHRNQL